MTKERILHNVGKYGSKGTCEDEIISKECAEEIQEYLILNHPIEGYSYRVLTKGINEEMYYKRDGVELPDGFKSRKIIPDVTTIVLVKNKDTAKVYPVLSGEDKYQKTKGNAIERVCKNYGQFSEKVCFGIGIVPYVIFCCGPGFFDESTGMVDEYFNAKFRGMMPYTFDGKPHIWSSEANHSIYRDRWNLLYLNNKRFTKEEKKEIMKAIAIASVKYYEGFLNGLG